MQQNKNGDWKGVKDMNPKGVPKHRIAKIAKRRANKTLAETAKRHARKIAA